MKRIFFAIICTVAVYMLSCNDDSDPVTPKETVLSKTYFDGVLETEYVYTDRQLSVIRDYKISTGELLGYTEFEYDSRGFLESSTYFKATGEATDKTLYLKNSDGLLTRTDAVKLSGADAGKVTARITYEYNKAGYISKRSWRDLDTNEEESYSKFFYYENGNRERYEHYWTVKPSPEKQFEVRYSPTERVLPESIMKRSGYPINFALDLLVSDQIKYEFFDTAQGPAGEYHEEVSDRVFDNNGFITSQTVTYRYIAPEAPDEVFVRTYEYEEI